MWSWSSMGKRIFVDLSNCNRGRGTLSLSLSLSLSLYIYIYIYIYIYVDMQTENLWKGVHLMYTRSIHKKTKQRTPVGIYKKQPQNPNYLQLRLCMKVMIEKFPISNWTLDKSKKDLMKLSFNLWFASSSPLKILCFTLSICTRTTIGAPFLNMATLLIQSLKLPLEEQILHCS